MLALELLWEHPGLAKTKARTNITNGIKNQNQNPNQKQTQATSNSNDTKAQSLLADIEGEKFSTKVYALEVN